MLFRSQSLLLMEGLSIQAYCTVLNRTANEPSESTHKTLPCNQPSTFMTGSINYIAKQLVTICHIVCRDLFLKFIIWNVYQSPKILLMLITCFTVLFCLAPSILILFHFFPPPLAFQKPEIPFSKAERAVKVLFLYNTQCLCSTQTIKYTHIFCSHIKKGVQ